MRKFAIRWAAVFLILGLTTQSVSAARFLIPVGQVIGLQIREDSVSVEGFDETLGVPAQTAGLKTGDRILQIDDTPIHCAQDIRQALRQSDGEVDVQILRGSTKKQLQIQPSITSDGPKLGIFLREGITGVGTVTYYDPQSGCFGALGHGVSDKDGTAVQMTDGLAYRAIVDSVRKGESGDPGQLSGSITDPTPFATLSKNTVQGVFGQTAAAFSGDELPVAEDIHQVQPGPATIRSTVQGNTVQEYSVEILKIYPSSSSAGRNLLLQVTDPALLAATGGIVQGMSGSPIIQDGKLVGAVTHVLVNDPTRGYGIFIENMLDAAG